LRLKSPGDSTASDEDGVVESGGKNLEDAVGAEADDGADLEVADGKGAAGAAEGAPDFGFVKKLRISMTKCNHQRCFFAKSETTNPIVGTANAI
jgi:hypothetical protein